METRTSIHHKPDSKSLREEDATTNVSQSLFLEWLPPKGGLVLLACNQRRLHSDWLEVGTGGSIHPHMMRDAALKERNIKITLDQDMGTIGVLGGGGRVCM